MEATQTKKLRLRSPLIVEGKYDKIKLSEVVESPIITLNGFAVFNNKEKQALLLRMCKNGELLVLTDSDSAGGFIRGRLRGILQSAKLTNIYIPQIKGREKRKSEDSKEGFLGVEGMDKQLLYSLLSPFEGEIPPVAGLSRAEFFDDGFSGRKNSAFKRAELCKALSLPANLSAKALLEAINLLVSREDYEKARMRVECQ